MQKVNLCEVFQITLMLQSVNGTKLFSYVQAHVDFIMKVIYVKDTGCIMIYNQNPKNDNHQV